MSGRRSAPAASGWSASATTRSVDSQPCGGTHVKATGEVGEIHIGKIEKKGRENRRFRIRFGPLPAQ